MTLTTDHETRNGKDTDIHDDCREGLSLVPASSSRGNFAIFHLESPASRTVSTTTSRTAFLLRRQLTLSQSFTTCRDGILLLYFAIARETAFFTSAA